MKELIKKLNNYRRTSIIVSLISLATALVAIALFVLYAFAGDISPLTTSRQPAFTSLGQNGRIIGMFYFIILIFVLALAIAVMYLSFPAILNKNKIDPKRSTLMVAVVNAGFELLALVLTVVEVAVEKSNTMVGFIICIPLLLITLLANVACIIPFIKCDFYMPQIKR